jgi:hypothetical protein
MAKQRAPGVCVVYVVARVMVRAREIRKVGVASGRPTEGVCAPSVAVLASAADAVDVLHDVVRQAPVLQLQREGLLDEDLPRGTRLRDAVVAPQTEPYQTDLRAPDSVCVMVR